MASSRKRAVTDHERTERDRRDQEVVRARKELAAYFRGERTEREARAALKTIKAFVRDRERTDAAGRAPLPGASPRLKVIAHQKRRRKGEQKPSFDTERHGRPSTQEDDESDRG
jgi:hypothetical protein